MNLRLPSWNTRPMPQLGMFLLGLWLLATGLLPLLHINLPYSRMILPLLATAAGVAILFDVKTRTLILGVLVLTLAVTLVMLVR